MNLKISPKGFRFRVDAVELGRLLEGQSLEQTISLDMGGFSYRISPVPVGEGLKVHAGAGEILLSVPRAVLECLRDAKPSKEGLVTRQGEIACCLQIDLRAGRERHVA